MGRFQKGQSGNPAGRKPGTGRTDKLRAAIDDDLPGIVTAMVEAAKAGDTRAAKLLLDRTMPALKPTAQPVKVPGLRNKSLSEQGAIVFDAIGKGLLSAEQTLQLLSALASLSKIREVDELTLRIEQLEQRLRED